MVSGSWSAASRHMRLVSVVAGMLFRVLAFVFGVFELVMPRQFVDFWMRLAAKNGEDVELESWVYAMARLEGVVLVVWALSGLRGRCDD